MKKKKRKFIKIIKDNKKFLFLFIIIMFLNIYFIFSYEVKINEIELNPTGKDSGNEWIELYSENEINLSDYKIVNSKNESYNLSGIIKGYFVMKFSKQFLLNKNEQIKLYKNNELIDYSEILTDNYNDERTWNLCEGKWKLLNSSPEKNNFCDIKKENDYSNNNSNNENNKDYTSNKKLSLDIELNDEYIINGEVFEIKLIFKNLEEKIYDIKVGVYKENKVLSEIYKNDKDWVSSNNYYSEFIEGPGDFSKNIKLRIKKSESNFSGKAEIIARIRESGSSNYKKEIRKEIEILKKKEKNYSFSSLKREENNYNKNKDDDSLIEESNNFKITSNTIRLKNINSLDSKNIKTKKNTIYESKNEIMKKYALYLLLFLSSFLIFLIISKRIK